MRSLRHEICQLLWPKVYDEPLEPSEIDSSVWKDSDNDIVEAIRDLIKCRDRFAVFVDEVNHGANEFNLRVNDSIAAALKDGGLMESIGGKKDGELG